MKKKTARALSLLIVLAAAAASFLPSCGGAKVTVTPEYCRIADEILPHDEEYVEDSVAVPASEKYVDLCLFANDLSGDDLDISGYVEAGGEKIEMKYYKENAGSSALLEGPVKAGEVAHVRLVAPIGEDAAGGDVTVKYTVSGAEYTAQIDGTDATGADPLAGKTELKVGDVVNVNDVVTFEVVESRRAEYGRLGKKFRMTFMGFDTVLKIKNVSGADIDPSYIASINFYYTEDGSITKGSERIELNSKLPDASELTEFDNGDEYYVHLLGHKPDDYFRFNLFGNTYYIAPTK